MRLCPGETQDKVIDYCYAHDILLEAYSPLGVGKIFQVPELKALAEKYGKSVAQICILWSLQRGYLAFRWHNSLSHRFYASRMPPSR